VTQPHLWPASDVLIQASALLQVRPELKLRPDAQDIAKAEYGHFIAQTFYFERLGVEIVSDLEKNAERPNQKDFFHNQLEDERRHVDVYRELIEQMPACYVPAPCIEKLRDSIIHGGSFHEKVIQGLVVLEALAIGLFSARIRYFPNGLSYESDLQTVVEEGRHHRHAVEIVAEMIKEERLSYGAVVDIVRSGIKHISSDLLPIDVAKTFKVDLSDTEILALQGKGIVGAQRRVTLNSIKSALRVLSLTNGPEAF